ncbi:hypothetical protein EJV46_14685 [Roseococcus sp. SYP-B2431]|uniref:hypothetical protein n=1 Tax=Roseococcus sp. SYP-B2431 TaxID=2496640 RepID=UPI00103D44B2|nr:hypothetical protein [Roseococcus sp. SYP-B2431]TCH97381.1 hypothetical protein EJV46_14685 [Roseococcus sp. SYP-B2431]
MQADRRKTQSAFIPRGALDGRRHTLSFDLSDLSELVAYLRPGASFHLAGHLCDALFPGTADQPVDLLSRCRGWAMERHCLPRLRDGGIEFAKLDAAAQAASPRAPVFSGM